MTTIRVDLGVSVSEATFNDINDASVGVKSTDLLDITGSSTNVGLEVLGAFTRSGSNNFISGTDVFTIEVLGFWWFFNTAASIKLTGLPASTVVAVKGVGSNTGQASRDTDWTIDSQTLTYDSSGGTTPQPPVDFTTTESNASGELLITVENVGAFGYISALELQYEEPGGISITALLNSNYMVEYSMKKNIASQSIGAQMITISDGSNFTGTVSVEVTIDNGTKTAGAGSVTHEGDGYHSYAPTQAETNGDHIAVSFTGTGALSQTIQVYTTFPQSADNDTKISALNDFNPTSDAVANVTLVGTTTTNTDMRGTNSANTVVPPSVAQFNARTIVNADYFLVTDYTAPDNAGITNILADTNDLQLNQGNWLTATGFNTVVPPSVVQFNARTLLSAEYSQFDYATNQVSADTVKVNGSTVLGNGTSSNLWRGS